MTESSLAIETTHLRKVYGGLSRTGFVAVDDISLAVPRGQVFGFLGPNGAGKTTTINMLLGNIRPTLGSGELLGKPIGNMEARRKIGFLPEKFQFHDFLTAEEFLDLHGRLYGMDNQSRRSRINEVLDIVGLSARRKSKIGQFSKGMQQRVGLAQAILNDPDLVILDEPTSALDPIGRREVREIVSGLKSRGKTVMLNSHLLSEIEMTCDWVAIVKFGRIIRQGKIDDLLAPVTTVKMRVLNQTPPLIARLRETFGSVDYIGDEITVSVRDEVGIASAAAIVVQNGGALLSLMPVRETLEDLFIREVEGNRTP